LFPRSTLFSHCLIGSEICPFTRCCSCSFNTLSCEDYLGAEAKSHLTSQLPEKTRFEPEFVMTRLRLLELLPHEGYLSTIVTLPQKKLFAMGSENSPSQFTSKRKLQSGPRLAYFIQRVFVWFAPLTPKSQNTHGAVLFKDSVPSGSLLGYRRL
jgi:hypothetical protein